MLPEPQAPSCASVPVLPFRRTSLAEAQQLSGVGQSGLRAFLCGRSHFIPGVPSSARGGQQPRDAPLDRGSVSVKSDKEKETERGRSVALAFTTQGITGPDWTQNKEALGHFWGFLVEWGGGSPHHSWRHENWERNKTLCCGALVFESPSIRGVQSTHLYSCCNSLFYDNGLLAVGVQPHCARGAVCRRYVVLYFYDYFCVPWMHNRLFGCMMIWQ